MWWFRMDLDVFVGDLLERPPGVDRREPAGPGRYHATTHRNWRGERMAGDLPKPAASDGLDDAQAQTTPPETEPDARFTFANERTFLAWHRTALALVVAGLAIVQLLPPFPGVPLGRHLLALPLIGVGGGLSVGSYLEWVRHQRALRRGEPLGTSLLPRVLAVAITALALAAVALTLFAHD
jgi:putative membrane protein